jgi:hypothetical protein
VVAEVEEDEEAAVGEAIPGNWKLYSCASSSPSSISIT